MKTSFFPQVAVFFVVSFLICISYTRETQALGIPPCEDDECTIQKEYVLNGFIKNLIKANKILSTDEIKSLIRSRKEILFEIEYGEVLGVKRPVWGIESMKTQPNRGIRINFQSDEICIKRIDVENSFPEPWRVGKTPAQWNNREASPNKPHNGAMSFREDSNFRFVFGFKPSGCAGTFLLEKE